MGSCSIFEIVAGEAADNDTLVLDGAADAGADGGGVDVDVDADDVLLVAAVAVGALEVVAADTVQQVVQGVFVRFRSRWKK